MVQFTHSLLPTLGKGGNQCYETEYKRDSKDYVCVCVYRCVCECIYERVYQYAYTYPLYKRQIYLSIHILYIEMCVYIYVYTYIHGNVPEDLLNFPEMLPLLWSGGFLKTTL